MSARVVSAEILQRRPGLWCPQCRCMTGVELVMAYHHPGGGLSVGSVARCTECRGPVRAPSE